MKTTQKFALWHVMPFAGKHIQRFFIHRAFGLLWVGQTISSVGSELTSGALQIAAVLVLGATPLQMGLLVAVSSIPALLIGQLVGVWVDRLPRRPLLIVADLARALLLFSIPLAALLGVLRIEQILIVALLVGIFSVCFEVAYRSFLPGLLPPERLVEGNSKLSASGSLASICGPSLGGLLVQVVTAPISILFDSVSFLISALSIALIRVPESAPDPIESQQTLWQGVRKGWQTLWCNSSLRALAACSASWYFFGGTFATLYTLYIVRTLGLTPVLYGLFVAVGGIGALLGALVTGMLARRIRPGWLLIGAVLLHGAMSMLTPLAEGSGVMMIVFLMLSQFCGDIGSEIYLINQVSLCQTLVPDRLLGRVNACMHFLVGGSLLLGSLVAGLLSEFSDIRLVLFLGSCGMLLSALWLLFSPLRHL